jgi:hypothetical protein
MLGMITAFAECVTSESKKLALSPPFYPTDNDTYARVLLKPGDWPIRQP